MSGLWTILVGNALPAVALAGLAFLVSRTFRRPALTHLLWVLVLVKLVTPPILPWSISVSPETAAAIGISPEETPAIEATVAASTPQFPEEQLISVRESRSSADLVPAASQIPADSSPTAYPNTEAAAEPGWLSRSASWLQAEWLLVFGVVWVMGSILSIVCVFRLLVCLRRRFRQAVPIDHPSRRHVAALAATLGLQRSPRVGLVEGIVSPLVWGVGPFTRIIFPRTLWEELSASSRDALLLHELAHYRRGDQWVRLLEIVVGCLYWWHPCVWWARRELAGAEEECCDAWVVRHAGHHPRNYAEAIITTLDYLAGEPVSRRPITTGVNTMPVLQRRLRHIMQKTVSPALPQRVRWGLLSVAAVMLPLQPFVQIVPGNSVAAALTADRQLEAMNVPQSADSISEPVVAVESPQVEDDLPPAPEGFWSQQTALPQRSSLLSPDRRYTIELRNGREAAAVIDNESQTRHDLTSEGITCLAFTPQGDRFVTGSRTGEVRVWDAKTGEAVSTVGHMEGDYVTSIDVSSDGTWAVTASDSGSLMIWELTSGSSKATWTATDSSRINCVRVLDDGRIAVSTGHFYDQAPGRFLILDADTLERIFDRATERVIATIEPDERSAGSLLLTDYSGAVWSWEGSSTDLTYRHVIPKRDVERAAFSSAFHVSTQL